VSVPPTASSQRRSESGSCGIDGGVACTSSQWNGAGLAGADRGPTQQWPIDSSLVPGSIPRARLYTLIASVERHGIDPQRYLTSVLATIGQTRLNELEQFLSDVFKRDDETAN